MPPRARFTRQELVAAALEIVKSRGLMALTARELGDRLGTSSRPVFTAFSSMEELKLEVFKEASRQFFEKSSDYKDYFPAFKRMGMHLVSFAASEPILFELLFIQKNGYASQTLEKLKSDCIEVIMRDNNISATQAEELFTQVWTFTAGLSVFASKGLIAFDENEISEKLSKAFFGAMAVVRAQIDKNGICNKIPTIKGEIENG